MKRYYRVKPGGLWTTTKRIKHKPKLKRETGGFDVEILTNIPLTWSMTHLHKNNLSDLLKIFCRFLDSANPDLLSGNVALNLEETFYGNCVLACLIISII